MSKARRAVVETVRIYYLHCPECNDHIEAPDGSLIWWPDTTTAEKTIACRCGTVVTLPAHVREKE